MQENRSYLPSADRVGVLIASVLLTFALTRLIQSPQFTLTIELPGFYFAYPLTLGTAMTILAAALTAAGMDWLTRGHPSLGKKPNIEHLMLPTLTTFVIGSPLALLPNGITWWIAFAFDAFSAHHRSPASSGFRGEVCFRPATSGYPWAWPRWRTSCQQVWCHSQLPLWRWQHRHLAVRRHRLPFLRPSRPLPADPLQLLLRTITT